VCASLSRGASPSSAFVDVTADGTHSAVCVCVCGRESERVCVCVQVFHQVPPPDGVATVSRIDKITGLFCRISSLL